MNISPFLSLQQPCNEALQWTKKQLTVANLRAVQTFDLQTARVALHDCPCPNHGTEECDCQMVVLLVYGKEMQPQTLILHGNDGQTWVSIADTPDQIKNTNTISAIRNALEAKLVSGT